VSKRAFDMLCSGLGLVLLSPLMITIAVIIKLTSDGPVFYRGIRTGLDGKSFSMLKFRTMVVGAENLGGPSTGLHDVRITNVGRWLRRYKLDELPQLLNVMRGQMSIVGPRPEVPLYTKDYTGDELLILTVKPGITDFASIEFARLDEVLGHEEPDRIYEDEVKPRKNALRIKYAREHSLRLDCLLIARTIRQIIFRG
jgi:lipopolysaccharide/colanic/teichoic acid biosynthesis glycosyltransferase